MFLFYISAFNQLSILMSSSHDVGPAKRTETALGQNRTARPTQPTHSDYADWSAPAWPRQAPTPSPSGQLKVVWCGAPGRATVRLDGYTRGQWNTARDNPKILQVRTHGLVLHQYASPPATLAFARRRVRSRTARIARPTPPRFSKRRLLLA